ncbi:capsid portal protein [macacine betaherpesvirus 9]|uniref:Capsid portal protein n=1 Tax=macacine betaherpesvirus 9 TaxID=2560568 RepID=A0A191S3T1_9BETA|nr:capsid portal protein [macacine betaherpesvirus 9]ANC96534.1 capsid portal protein [macacine betaherpesvirus 9]
MLRYQSSGKGVSKQRSDKAATFSTINSILEADDMLRRNFVSYLPGNKDNIDIFFPSSKTFKFVELLHGNKEFFKGQSIHSVLRDATVIKKQLFYTLARMLLNSISIQQINVEWKRHIKLFPFRKKGISFQEYFNIWYYAIKQLILDEILETINYIIQNFDNDIFNKYIDWVCTIGIVPFANVRKNKTSLAPLIRSLSSTLIQDIINNKQAFLTHVLIQISSTVVPDFNEITIAFQQKNIICLFKNQKIEHLIYSAPYQINDQKLFTTPVAHLYAEINKYENLQKHRKMCQLLNTFPIKVLTTSKNNIDNKKILELIEKEEKNTDAKKSLIKFLLNLSDSKSKIGITDSIEGFLQEITPSIIDHNKLLLNKGNVLRRGQENDRDVRDVFKRQIIKCMEEQIQSQVDEIEALKAANRVFETKIKDLQSIVNVSDNTKHDFMLDADIESLSLAKALNKVQSLPFTSVSIEDTRTVANSFFSQYIPDIEYADKKINQLWETEYIRTFRLRRNVNNQGQEDSISYSNYTLELLIIPFMKYILKIKNFELLPEEFLFLSLKEILTALYSDCKIKQYLRLIYLREINETSQFIQNQTRNDYTPNSNISINLHEEDFSELDNGVNNKLKRIKNCRHIQHIKRPEYL